MSGRSSSALPPVVAVVGWKNSGKTTLVERLIAEFVRRGYHVGAVKHAHHAFQIDDGETDSARHRRAGARRVAVVSPERWAVVREIGHGEVQPPLEEVVRALGPCDLVIVEGYKAAAVPKVEARRQAALQQAPLADGDDHVIAIAADHTVTGARVPVLAIDDVEGVAALIAAHLSLARAAC
jgi:molybdopterin-guanine dinucleotide biosynthesis protein B